MLDLPAATSSTLPVRARYSLAVLVRPRLVSFLPHVTRHLVPGAGSLDALLQPLALFQLLIYTSGQINAFNEMG